MVYSQICVLSVHTVYAISNVRRYAVIPGVGIRAMPVASVPSIKSYAREAGRAEYHKHKSHSCSRFYMYTRPDTVRIQQAMRHTCASTL